MPDRDDHGPGNRMEQTPSIGGCEIPPGRSEVVQRPEADLIQSKIALKTQVSESAVMRTSTPLEVDPQLARVLEVWPALSDAVRSAIVAVAMAGHLGRR